MAAVHRRSCASLARPPAFATRWASEGAFSSTITRWPTETGTGGAPTRPYQALAGTCAKRVGAAATCSRTAAISAAASVAATATTSSSAICGRAPSGRGRVRIHGKVARWLLGLPEPGRRRDHRRVVRAERERREGCAAEGAAELRVGGDAADNRDPIRRGLLDAPDERADDRALVARREVGPAPLELGGVEVTHRVEQRRLHAREGEVEARHARDRERVRLRIALLREPV